MSANEIGALKEAKLHMDQLQAKVKELEHDILAKSETLARLERSHQNPVSPTVSLVQEVIHFEQQQQQQNRPSNPFLNALGGGGIKLKPTLTKVSSNSVGFPEVEQDSSEASEILPWLFLSGNIVARDLDALRKHGISRVLNAAHTVCPNYFLDVEPKVHYTSFDLIDHPSETIDHFILNAIDEIEYAREHSERILVHCHQGISRSATLVTAYIAWKENMSVVDALMYVKARRKIVQPNSGFLEQLKNFEERLRVSRLNNPSLHHVTAHSDEVSTLVVKQIFDANRPLIDDDDVFLLYEGSPNGDILIRKPLVKDIDAKYLETAVRVAGWMIKYEKAFSSSKIIVCEYNDERFTNGLNAFAARKTNEKLILEEIVDSSSGVAQQ